MELSLSSPPARVLLNGSSTLGKAMALARIASSVSVDRVGASSFGKWGNSTTSVIDGARPCFLGFPSRRRDAAETQRIASRIPGKECGRVRASSVEAGITEPQSWDESEQIEFNGDDDEVQGGASGIAADPDDVKDEENGSTIPKKESKRGKRARLERELLELGTSPIDVLTSSEEEGWRTDVFWTVVNILAVNSRVPEVLLVFEWWKQQANYTPRELHYVRFMRMCGYAHLVDRCKELFDEMVSVGIQPTVGTYTCLLQCYAEAGLFDKAEETLDLMLEAGLKPNAVTYTGLLHAYGKHGRYNEMAKVFNDMKTYQTSQPDCAPTAVTYSVVVQCYARGGLFRRMERVFQEMVSKNLSPDALSVNASVQAYAEAGLLKEMERTYSLIKMYRVGIKLETVRAVASAYIRKSYFYQLGNFVRHVKRNRLNMGNLLENLLLLSHAANFQMRGLAREYIILKESGFDGDITSFNIRALAFSQAKMFWDLRVTVLEMQHQKIMPDLVTYGAVVDAYVAAELVGKLPEALMEMHNLDARADIRTDTLVFEAFGRGVFQLCCEELALEVRHEEHRHLTYANLIGYFLKKLEITGAIST
ncbi:hypothetical protein R1flu_021193 [Riccia fluitans]|uniref:Pentatricopeptide repeat-containing protein n=1 Tax=Riccia fluitans TaxID=41844 RepID=A0ABD1ZP01_9MARC